MSAIESKAFGGIFNFFGKRSSNRNFAIKARSRRWLVGRTSCRPIGLSLLRPRLRRSRQIKKVSKRERESARESQRVGERVCVCEQHRMVEMTRLGCLVWVRVCLSWMNSERERKRESVCVCVWVWERESERVKRPPFGRAFSDRVSGARVKSAC